MENQTAEENPKSNRTKVAILFAYCGAGYKGMQSNPGAKTIESDLQQALYLSGAIPEPHLGYPKRFDFARSARTDKGVSAIGQVVSGKFYIDPPGFIQRINNNLPAQIRVFGFTRVAASFSAKKSCDQRRYVYLLPVFALDPASHRDRESVLASLGSGNELVKCWDCSERGRKVFRSGFDGGVQSGISSNMLSASSGSADNSNRGGGNGVVEKGNVFKYGEKERERFNRILKQYEGTHNFHNFTTRTKANDPAANRCVLSFNADATVTVEGIEFVKCVVIGQSFMLHQIRKMIGLAVAIMRNCGSESLIETALQQDVKIKVPTAPEVGLYLDECFFSSYNQKCKDTHEEVSMKAYAEEAEDFKLTHIYSHIASAEHKEGVVAVWLHSLNYRNYPDLRPKKNSEANDVGTQTEQTIRCNPDTLNDLSHILPRCFMTEPLRYYEKPTVHEIDLEHLAATMKKRLNLVFPYIHELRVRYGGVTEEAVTDAIITGVNMMVDTAMSVTYNRLRYILQSHEPTVFAAQMNPKSPLSNRFKFPAYISSVLNSIGPLHITDGPQDMFVVYATSADRSQTYGRAQHFDFKWYHFERLIKNLEAIGAPLAPIDVKGSSIRGGSFYPTILPDNNNLLWDFTATCHHSNYEPRDIVSAWLTLDEDPALRAFPDCSMRIECCTDPNVVNAVIASFPEGVPDVDGAMAPARPSGLNSNVNFLEGSNHGVSDAVYIVGRGSTRYYCTSIARNIYEYDMTWVLQEYILRYDASSASQVFGSKVISSCSH